MKIQLLSARELSTELVARWGQIALQAQATGSILDSNSPAAFDADWRCPTACIPLSVQPLVLPSAGPIPAALNADPMLAHEFLFCRLSLGSAYAVVCGLDLTRVDTT